MKKHRSFTVKCPLSASVNSGTKEIFLSQVIQTANTTVENKTVYIISDTDISVNVLVSGGYRYGGFLVFPLQQTLRNVSFLVASFPVYTSKYPSEIQLIASRNSTRISIEFPDDLTGTYIQNNAMHLTLDERQTYQLQSVYDLSGTRIQSSAPISVISGTMLAQIGSRPRYSGYIIDQMPPVVFLGTRFIVPTLETRTGYYIKIIAPENHISVKLHKSTGTYSFMLYRGIVQNILMNNSEPVFILSNRPVMVSQYGLDYNVDRKGGEMMMVVPSISNYMNRYNFLIPSIQSPFANFLSVISLTTNVSDIIVDSQPLSSSASTTSYIKTVAGNFTISVVKLLPGRHSVASKSGTTTFGALLYGFYSSFGYGFPLGMRATQEGNCCTNCLKKL